MTLDTNNNRLILQKSVTRYELNIYKCLKNNNNSNLKGFRMESPGQAKAATSLNILDKSTY